MIKRKLPNYVFDDKYVSNVFIYNSIFIFNSLFFKKLFAFLRIINETQLDFKILESKTQPTEFSNSTELYPLLHYNIENNLPDEIFTKLSYKIKKSKKELEEPEYIKIIFDNKIKYESEFNSSKETHKNILYEYIDIFTLHNQISVSGRSNEWTILFDRQTEWLLIGISNKTIMAFKDTFLVEMECEPYRYQTLESAINNNPSLAWAHSNEKNL